MEVMEPFEPIRVDLGDMGELVHIGSSSEGCPLVWINATIKLNPKVWFFSIFV
jgi:hypothetical protein